MSWEKTMAGESQENRERFTEIAAKISEAVIDADRDLRKVLKMTGGNVRTTLLNNLKMLEQELGSDFAGK